MIQIKRLRKSDKTVLEKYADNFEVWIGYWRANIHRFITEYLGLNLYDFQKPLIYYMDKYPNFIFIASRGAAKSTAALIFAVARAILYPNQKILVVCPVKSQSKRFIKKVYDLIRESPNLALEIDEKNIRTGINESEIPFFNGSQIYTTVYSENALGERIHILIVDEFVRTDKDVITRVFDPMLSDTRKPPYREISAKERRTYYQKEELMKYYLSSIRRADEWSYQTFVEYVDNMCEGNPDFFAMTIPYQCGVKNGFISKKKVENTFKSNRENREILLAEYSCIPEKASGNSFFSYKMMNDRRTNSKAMCCMSDEEFVLYKNDKSKFPYYVEKAASELRVLMMDLAVIESKNNDNTSFFIIRLIPSGGSYKRIVAYGESMHGINSVIQAKRAKQLFYEFDCDYFVLDCQGVGAPLYDIMTTETYDDIRDITYPAWCAMEQEDTPNLNHPVDEDAVPIIYAVKTPISIKSQMFSYMRNVFTEGMIDLLLESQDVIEYLDKKYSYYKIDDSDLKVRILNPYVQTDLLISEAINLEQVATQGYLNLKEQSGRRKDRVMSLAYGLWFVKILIEKLTNQQNSNSILDYILSV